MGAISLAQKRVMIAPHLSFLFFSLCETWDVWNPAESHGSLSLASNVSVVLMEDFLWYERLWV